MPWKASRASSSALPGSTAKLQPIPAQPGSDAPGLETPAIVPAHPAAVLRWLFCWAGLTELRPIRSASATVLEPASEYGRAAMDELHQQTVKLLSFQELPRQVYDTQVAFNATPAFGDSAKFSPRRQRIPHPPPLCSALRAAACRTSASSSCTRPSSTATASPSPSSSTRAVHSRPDGSRPGRGACGDRHRGVRPAHQPHRRRPAKHPRPRAPCTTPKNRRTTRFWIWAGLDNLRFAVLNAVACALELKRLRPSGEVQ